MLSTQSDFLQSIQYLAPKESVALLERQSNSEKNASDPTDRIVPSNSCRAIGPTECPTSSATEFAFSHLWQHNSHSWEVW